MQKTLNDLSVGEESLVLKVLGAGPIRRRLMDMGVVKGTKISVEKIAPMGDPIEVKVKGYSLTFRKEDAKNIIIE